VADTAKRLVEQINKATGVQIPEASRIRELEAQVAMLTDTVVMAACLWFDEITDESERRYASEVLHETASALVRDNPRLDGGYKKGVDRD
jgi:hypothetical protein